MARTEVPKGGRRPIQLAFPRIRLSCLARSTIDGRCRQDLSSRRSISVQVPTRGPSPTRESAILANEYADGATEGRLPILELPAFVGDTLLREISSLSGWIAARLGVSEALRMQTTEADEVTSRRSD